MVRFRIRPVPCKRKLKYVTSVAQEFIRRILITDVIVLGFTITQTAVNKFRILSFAQCTSSHTYVVFRFSVVGGCSSNVGSVNDVSCPHEGTSSK